MSDQVQVYISTISTSSKMSSNISKVDTVLKSNHIDFSFVDVAQDHDLLIQMRSIVQDDKATPIQFTKGGTHLGDFSAFDDAVECGTVKDFCKC